MCVSNTSVCVQHAQHGSQVDEDMVTIPQFEQIIQDPLAQGGCVQHSHVCVQHSHMCVQHGRVCPTHTSNAKHGSQVDEDMVTIPQFEQILQDPLVLTPR